VKYVVQLSNRSQKDLDKLDSTVRMRIVKALKRLESDPRIGFSLLGPLTGKWKLRVGAYRVIYTIEDDKLMVLVITVAHRREVYRRPPST